ncbi:MAG TPA: PLP-dependent aminotransferase family protein [Streptosporangiaceae bacterium]|nr:PLP-dependent aminotransferase family protein [Streptosporangiaceae bacterium]
MLETWATSGADLHLELAVSGTRVRRGLEDALRDAIQAGRLRPGTRLPSSRSLAADLSIARNTVADVYGQLAAEGWLVAEHGSGTRVAERMIAERSATAADHGHATAPRYSLIAGSPDLSAFPRSAWLTAARRALAGAPAEAFGYTDPRGRPELRQALADYLSRARGVRAAADRIVVCSGFTQALALLAKVLAARGATTLAVEAYGHHHHREVAAAQGLAVAPVPVDSGGAVIAELAGADAALLTPAHQFPLGVPLAARRRAEAAAWAAATGATIIEDDYDGEFRYDRQAIGAMQALEPESIVYAGTASKTLAPGLRLAWLVLPARLVEDVTAAKVLADRQTSSLDQLTFAELISSGAYDRHVRRCRMTYRRRRERLVTELRDRAPAVRMTGVAAGLHAVMELPPGSSEDEVVGRAARRGLALSGLSEFAAADARHPPALVVGFAAPPAHAFTTALARLCAVLADPVPD